MSWIRVCRENMGLELDEFARTVNEYRRLTVRSINGIVSVRLIHMLEVDAHCVTHPVIANAIASVCGATAEQRDGIVAEVHRGTWMPLGDADRVRRVERAMMRAKRGGSIAAADTPKATSAERVQYSFQKHPVVKLDRYGNVLARYDTSLDAAMANNLGVKSVKNRCYRRVVDVRSMFFQDGMSGFTFRFADEWERMTHAERLADIKAGREYSELRNEGEAE